MDPIGGQFPILLKNPMAFNTLNIKGNLFLTQTDTGLAVAVVMCSLPRPDDDGEGSDPI